MISAGLRAAIAASMPGGLVLVGVVGTTFNDTATPTRTLNGTLTGGIATSPAAGDIVLAAASQTSSSVNRSLTLAGDTTGAYTPIGDLWADGSVEANLSLAWAVMGATPDTSIVGGGFAGNGSSGGILAAVVLRGAHATPLSPTPATATGTLTNRGTPPAITPTYAGSRVITFGTGAYANTRTSPLALSGWDVLLSLVSSGSSYNSKLIVGMQAWTGGTVTPTQWSDSDPDSTGAAWAAGTISLRRA